MLRTTIITDTIVELKDRMENRGEFKPDELITEYLTKTQYPDYRDMICNWVDSLEHYMGESSDHEKHPNFLRYTIKVHCIPRNIQKDFLRTNLPLEVIEHLDSIRPNTHGSTNWSYDDIPQIPSLIYTIGTADEALYTILELERVADWVQRDYDDDLKEGESSAWDTLGLGGDDDVDYNGSYLESACEFYRIFCYLTFDDSRFLTQFNTYYGITTA